jgi:hypothetical protein
MARMNARLGAGRGTEFPIGLLPLHLKLVDTRFDQFHRGHVVRILHSSSNEKAGGGDECADDVC